MDKEFMSTNNTINDTDETIDFKFWLSKFINNWAFFVLSVIVCLVLSFAYLRYSTPSFNISSKLMVEDQKGGGASSGSGAVGIDFSSIFGLPNNAQNELEILKSKSLINSVIDQMQLNVTIYRKGFINSVELYDEAPFAVSVNYKINVDSVLIRNYDIELLGNDSFSLKNGKAVRKVRPENNPV